ncbi:MAG: xanthine dehydrogenase small subunit [Bosea sp. (in: a-proteobacteria)]
MRRAIRFILNDETVEIAACDPTRSALDWLRRDARLSGTKEGCNEGDCGACTILVGRLTAQGLMYEAINACIRFLPSLDGCHMLTVEHLKSSDGALHPIQRMMAEFHGSQCGFCTPGIVMSLMALWLNEAAPDRQRIEDALAGNLCRCTGYAPIIRAAEALFTQHNRMADPMIARRDELAMRLATIQERHTLEVGDNARTWLAPTTTGALAALYQQYPQATLVAGATDVGLWVTKGMQQPETVIWLGRIAELQGVTETERAIRFGAMVNHIEVRQRLGFIHAHLDELMRRFGGEQVRNAGTIGGNIANGSPIGDLPPALIALGATLHLRQGETRRDLPLEDFFLAYRQQDRREAEFVEAITVPKLGARSLFHVSKISKRFDEDISALCGAFRLERDSHGHVIAARLAFGGMAATPKRAKAAEAALMGRRFDVAAVEAAQAALAQDFSPLTDMRASSAYRMKVAQNLLERFLMETIEPQQPIRVAGPLAETSHAG